MRHLIRNLACGLVLLVTGCALTRAASSSLPYDAWYLGFQAPRYMEVWLETADVEDVRGHVFYGVMAGTVAISYSGEAGGWGQQVTMGAGRDVTGVALPKRIYVRWQSLVEPQTYGAVLTIPESVRQLMLSKAPSVRAPIRYDYRRILTIALAPGGWIKAWVTSAASEPVEVLCQKAEIEPKGPYQGLSEGKYRPLSKRAAPYISTHPIPYDSWRCADDAPHATP